MIKPKISPYIVGIDLGTSNSSVALYFKGRAEIIPIDGKPVLPSVVHARNSGEFLVGYPAKSQLLIDPENTVASVKSEMGNPTFKKEFKGQPGRTYTASDLSAEILSKIRLAVSQSDHIDFRGTLKYGVVCIPANFDDAKKQATLEAGRLAGLEIRWLLEEPVAAAIAYAVDAKRDQNILVYDLGGGTFDVSILSVDSTGNEESNFRILAKEGIPRLGGDDFDQALMELIDEKLKKSGGVSLFDSEYRNKVEERILRQAHQKLKEAAEGAKLELSEAGSAEIVIPNLFKDKTGKVHHIEEMVTRTQFEKAITNLVMQTRTVMEKALKNANYTIDDISRIVLVGGATRVPLVRKMVTEFFGKEPYCDLDPSTAVARGAAIFGASLGVPTSAVEETSPTLQEDTPDVSFNIIDIVTHFLGIGCIMDEVQDRFSTILDKGLEISREYPIVREESYFTVIDKQTEMEISIYQSVDHVYSVFDEGSVCIGKFILKGIPPKPKGMASVVVRFELDQQNLLKVTATSRDDSGVSNSLEINQGGRV